MRKRKSHERIYTEYQTRRLWVDAIYNMPTPLIEDSYKLLAICLGLKKPSSVVKAIRAAAHIKNKEKFEHLKALAGPGGRFLAQVKLANLGFFKPEP